jgi:hypothetical protein
MKKLSTLMMVALVMLLASCTSSPADKLLKKIPANATAVAVINVEEVIASAGGSIKGDKVNLPSYVTDSYLSSMTDFAGAIDPRAVVVAYVPVLHEAVAVYSITDENKFVAALSAKGYQQSTTEGDYKAYAADSNFPVITADDIAYAICRTMDASDALAAIKTMHSQAADNNYASTGAAKQFGTHDICGAVAMSDILGGYPEALPITQEMRQSTLVILSDLKGDDLKGSISFVNEKGKKISLYSEALPSPKNVDLATMRYLGENEVLAFGTNLKGMKWDKALDQMGFMPGGAAQALALIEPYLRNINGTVAVGLGVNNGMASLAKIVAGQFDPTDLTFTIVAKMASGEAEKTVSTLQSLAVLAGGSTPEKGGFSVALGSADQRIYVVADQDHLVVSSHAVNTAQKPDVVKDVDWDEWTSGMALRLTPSNSLMRDLNITSGKVEAELYNKTSSEYGFEVEFDDFGAKGFIENLVKFCNLWTKGCETYNVSFTSQAYSAEPDFIDDVDDDDDALVEIPDSFNL